MFIRSVLNFPEGVFKANAVNMLGSISTDILLTVLAKPSCSNMIILKYEAEGNLTNFSYIWKKDNILLNCYILGTLALLSMHCE